MPRNAPTDQNFSVVVLVSGSGSNLQALIDQVENKELPIDIKAVISNKPQAYALKRAELVGISAICVDHKAFDSRESYDETLKNTIDAHAPDLVILAGFMRILTDDFVNHYLGRLINIHPSLLPKYKGLNTHQRAIDANDREHGVSVHFVTPELDNGPVIAQSKVSIQTGDTATTLAQRVQEKEHLLYPLVIKWIAEGRLTNKNDDYYLDNQELNAPVIV